MPCLRCSSTCEIWLALHEPLNSKIIKRKLDADRSAQDDEVNALPDTPHEILSFAFSSGNLLQLVYDIGEVDRRQSDAEKFVMSVFVETILGLGSPLHNPYLRTFMRNAVFSEILAHILVEHITTTCRTIPDTDDDDPEYTDRNSLIYRSLMLAEDYLLLGAISKEAVRADGGRSSVTPKDRTELLVAIQAHRRSRAFPHLSQDQKNRIFNLEQFLVCIDQPGRIGIEYSRQTRRAVRKSYTLSRCALEGCLQRGIAVCGQCQCTRYCSRRCQRVDWKAHHSMRCFKTNYRGLDVSLPWADAVTWGPSINLDGSPNHPNPRFAPPS
jgi:hypothetical protein